MRRARPRAGLHRRGVRHRAFLRRADRRRLRLAPRSRLHPPLQPHLLASGEMIPVAMATDLTVVMRDEPGELAKLGEVTVAAGVHLRGLAAFTGDGRGFVHALVDDGDVATATQALKRAKMKVADSREV